jgi:hypothetical protein
MGYGQYSQAAHDALLDQRTGIPPEHVFKQQSCHPLMNPKGVKLRESRDSAEHPQSLAIAFALDVTGSMGDIPRHLAVSTLPKFMKVLGDCKVRDPQVLFCAVGDATSDRAPLQVGQFETTAELMDQWLTWSFLEGGGGGTGEESYELAMYFLALHTEMDCVVKRQRRGYLFMTGDELPYPVLSRHVVESVIGDRLDEDLKVEEVIAELQRHYSPFFLIPDQARRARCERRWRDLLGDHVLCLEKPEDVCFAAGGAIALCEKLVPDLDALARVLQDAGAEREQVKRAVRTLASLSPSGAIPSSASSPAAPSLLKRLFKKA